MVCSKNLIGLAALVIQPITSCCNSYYSYFGLNLGTVLQGVLDLVSYILDLVVSVIGGLLDSVTGILGISIDTVTFNNYLSAPTNKGQQIDLCIRLVLALHPILEECSPGLGDFCVQAFLAQISIIVSSLGGIDGLTLITPMSGNKNQWWSQLKCASLKSNWKKHCNSVGYSSMTGPKRVCYDMVNSIVVSLSLNPGNINYLLGNVLCFVYGLVGLLGNLIDGLLLPIFNALFGWHKQFNCGGNYVYYQKQYTQRCSPYKQSSFDDCFSN